MEFDFLLISSVPFLSFISFISFFFSFCFLQTDLQNDFRTVPQPVQGIAGDSVVLECEPPRGHPEPQIRWKKNGQSLELDLDLGVDSDRYDDDDDDEFSRLHNFVLVTSANFVC